MRHREGERLRALYKKLLTLYPRGFREQLRESMEQTVDDLWKERMQQTVTERVRFVVWLFCETGVGVGKEHVLVLKQEKAMGNTIGTLKSAALISAILVLPLAILELVNNPITKSNGFGVIALFSVMWLLPVLSITAVAPIVRHARGTGEASVHAFGLVTRIALFAFFVFVWASLVIDQMPCFLGVPNCD